MRTIKLDKMAKKKNEPHCNNENPCSCHYCLSSTEGICPYGNRFEKLAGDRWKWKDKPVKKK